LTSGGASFAEVSARARLRGTGPDLLNLLHRLSTQDLGNLPVGEGRPTVLTNPKGRIVERLFVHRLAERDVLLVGGDGRAPSILAHLKKYTFAEDTGLVDLTPDTACFALPGPEGAALVADPGPWGAVEARLDGIPVRVLGQDGFTAEGRSVVSARGDVERVRAALSLRGTEVDAAALERYRIARALPGAGELNEDWNPLEVGLRDHVSFAKGCYVGQEVVARLNTYDKVARRIVRLRFSAGDPVPRPGDEVTKGDRGVGRLTSVVEIDGGGALALALVKTRELPLEDAAVSGRPAEVLKN
jgi:folate-binding protein YgfZ